MAVSISDLLKLRGHSLNPNSNITWDICGETRIVDRIDILETLRLIEGKYTELSQSDVAIVIEIIDEAEQFRALKISLWQEDEYIIGIEDGIYHIEIKNGMINNDYSITLSKALGTLLSLQALNRKSIISKAEDNDYNMQVNQYEHINFHKHTYQDKAYQNNKAYNEVSGNIDIYDICSDILISSVGLYYTLRILQEYSTVMMNTVLKSNNYNFHNGDIAYNETNKQVRELVSSIVLGISHNKAKRYREVEFINKEIKVIIKKLNNIEIIDKQSIDSLRLLVYMLYRKIKHGGII